MRAPRVLFVDDEKSMCDMLSDFFRQKGYEVYTATSGEDAKEIAHATHLDLAFFDIGLANENGLELLTFFKGKFPHVPVIMFTGMTDDHLVDIALNRGASGFMRKTDPLEDLFDATQAYMRRP